MNLARNVVLLCLLACTQAQAQTTELFFSEYIEGSSNNKALEIYNGTGAAVDLSVGNYDVQFFFNGSTSAGATIALTGTVVDGDVYVVADDGSNAIILATADITPTNGFFNGDDAILLRKNGVVIDSIGQLGTDPGAAWLGSGLSTQNQTLTRKADICAGDIIDNDAFDPSLEWDGLAQDDTSNLGAHTANCGGAPTQPQLLLSEVVVTPTAGEYIEIFNPNAVAVDLSDVYLTDATFAGGSTFYYNIVTGTNAGGGSFGDFLARFPDGASIAPGEYQTVALTGSTGFFTTYGSNPDYELFEDDGTPDATPDMREALAGSINGQGGLTNDGEVVILFAWDGGSDLVTDLDYVVWGDKVEAVDKTGISIDGPDVDGTASSYQNDTAIANQDIVSALAHLAGESYQREDLLEGSELISGGNGANGHDETSEDLSITWCEDAPTPGAITNCAPIAATGVIINEILADPDATAGDANGDGVVNTTQDEFVEIVNNTGAPLDVSGWTLSDGVSVRHTFPAGSVIADQCAALIFAGGTPTGVFGGAVVQLASSGGLGLNNAGDTVRLNDGVSDQATASYGSEGGNNQSLTLDPDITGAAFVQHSTATGSAGALFSPGTSIDGSLLPGCFVAPPIVINEIHADPDAAAGDANGDSVVSTTQDEFVEIVNNTGAALDLSGWTLADGAQVRHIFPAGTIIADQCAAVVFGGGTPTGGFGGATVQVASTGGLGLNNGGDTLTLNDGVNDQAIVAYGAEGGNNQSLTLEPDISGAGFVQHTLANGAAGALFSAGTRVNGNAFSGCNPPPPILICGNPATAISAVQGSGFISPLLGNTVQVEGVVVADFQGAGGLDGFFIQEEDAQADADPTTSEGVFVFDSGVGVDVQVGDRVRLSGDVAEFFEETQIANVTAVSTCASNVLNEITRQDINLPAASLSDLEAFEGMWVRLPQTLTVSDVFNLVRFGEFVASNGRLYQPTQVVAPGAPAQAQQAANDLNRIIIDDGRNGANQMPLLPGQDDVNPLNATNPVRAGFTVSNNEGALGFAFGSYRLQSLVPPQFNEASNPRTANPGAPTSNLKVASFNVLNFFTTLTQPGATCGPNNLSCRGANTATELVRQTDKLVQALLALDADVVALIEVENNASASLQALVDGLNAIAGAGTWDYIDAGTVGTDAVKPAFIYRAADALPVGAFAILDETVDPRFDTSRQRPSIAQTFSDSNNGKLTVVVNHLRAKGSCPNDMGPNDDTGDGQACWNLWRTLSMQAMVDWLDTDPTNQGDTDYMLVGDFNSYGQEDPLQVLYNAAYTNLEVQFNGGNPEVYSFTFFGQAGSLDHAIANSSTVPQVVDIRTWHINSDEYVGFDYNEEDLPGSGGVNLPKPANFYSVDPYRTADHDPLLISLNLLSDVSTSFAVATSSVAENLTSVNVQVNLIGNASFPAQVRVQNTGGTATAGVDYVAVDQVLNFPTGTSTAMFSVTIMDDALVEGDETIVLSLSDAQGNSLGNITSHTITLADDDSPGSVVNPTSGLMTTELGASDSFTVVLTSAPTAEVNIPVLSNNPAEGVTDVAQLLFDVANWNVPQTVTVTGVADSVIDGDQAYLINLGPAQSSDGAWNGLTLASVAVTNLDTDVAVVSISGPAATGTGVVTVDLSGGGASCGFDIAQTSFDPLSSIAQAPPAGLEFPHGVVRFQATNCAPGATLNFTLTLPQALGLNGELWKFGPASAGASDSWFLYPASVAGDTISFAITDGGVGDADGQVNGVIVDPVGAAINGLLNPVAVPALNRWGLLLLLLSVLGIAAHGYNRHQRRVLQRP